MRQGPLVPPKAPFVDGGHYASYLALLDALDRASWAERSCGERRLYFAFWAFRSAQKALGYLAGSNLERGPFHTTRPEYRRATIEQQLRLVRDHTDRLGREVVDSCQLEDPAHFGGGPCFVLALPANLGGEA